MKKSLLLEKLSNAFGIFGLVLYYVITFSLSFAPLIILGFPFWVNLILVIVILAVPVLGEIALLGLFVWAFIVAVGQPIDAWSIVLFVAAAVYVFTTLVPLFISFFQRD